MSFRAKSSVWLFWLLLLFGLHRCACVFAFVCVFRVMMNNAMHTICNTRFFIRVLWAENARATLSGASIYVVSFHFSQSPVFYFHFLCSALHMHVLCCCCCFTIITRRWIAIQYVLDYELMRCDKRTATTVVGRSLHNASAMWNATAFQHLDSERSSFKFPAISTESSRTLQQKANAFHVFVGESLAHNSAEPFNAKRIDSVVHPTLSFVCFHLSACPIFLNEIWSKSYDCVLFNNRQHLWLLLLRIWSSRHIVASFYRILRPHVPSPLLP